MSHRLVCSSGKALKADSKSYKTPQKSKHLPALFKSICTPQQPNQYSSRPLCFFFPSIISSLGLFHLSVYPLVYFFHQSLSLGDLQVPLVTTWLHLWNSVGKNVFRYYHLPCNQNCMCCRLCYLSHIGRCSFAKTKKNYFLKRKKRRQERKAFSWIWLMSHEGVKCSRRNLLIPSTGYFKLDWFRDYGGHCFYISDLDSKSSSAWLAASLIVRWFRIVVLW